MRTFLTIILFTSVSWGQERGVYIGYSDSVLQVINQRPTIVDEVMQKLSVAGVTHVWTTNGPDTYERVDQWVTTANKYNIKCRIGSGHWYINTVLDDPATKFNRINNLWVSLSPSSRPFSFVIGDETVPECRSLTAELASRCRANGIDTTYTVLSQDYALFVGAVGSHSSYAACDYYPFFAPGLASNPPYGGAALTRFSSVFQSNLLPASNNGTKPLAIVQGFQDWSGPATLDSNSNLVRLPGSQQLFRAPTAKETSWQIYDAVSTVGHGVYVFAYGLGGPSWTPNPSATPTNNPNLSPPLTTTVNTGATTTLVSFPQYADGPAMAGLRRAYSRLKQVDGLLPNLVEANYVVNLSPKLPGDRAKIKVDPRNGKRYLVVITDPTAGSRLMFINNVPTPSFVMPLTSLRGAAWFNLFWVTMDGGDMGIWQL